MNKRSRGLHFLISTIGWRCTTTLTAKCACTCVLYKASSIFSLKPKKQQQGFNSHLKVSLTATIYLKTHFGLVYVSLTVWSMIGFLFSCSIISFLLYINWMQSAVSGLNRGLAANEEDLTRAESAAKELEAVGGVVDLTKHQDKLQGQWKLIYSSAFSSRALGGSRPGPPTGRLLPITLGQVC